MKTSHACECMATGRHVGECGVPEVDAARVIVVVVNIIIIIGIGIGTTQRACAALREL